MPSPSFGEKLAIVFLGTGVRCACCCIPPASRERGPGPGGAGYLISITSPTRYIVDPIHDPANAELSLFALAVSASLSLLPGLRAWKCS